MIKEIPCVIFAGGRSSRMGEDKALLAFAGFKTLTQYQYKKFSRDFEKVFISCKEKEKFCFEAQFIEDDKRFQVFAPTVALFSAMQALKTSQYFFAVSVDTPFINIEVFQTLAKHTSSNADVIVANLNGKYQPLCALYSTSLLKRFQEAIDTNQHKLHHIFSTIKTLYIDFDDEKTFLNMNHPQDYQQALQQLEQK